MTERMAARLATEDGTVLHGTGFGACATQVGEVVFNTSLTGYQEIMTDPSYAQQIVVMTAPMIGNTGVTAADDESRGIFASGLVVRKLSGRVSNWRAEESLPDWLAARGVPAIEGVDTRALTRRLRDGGSLKGVISTESKFSDQELVSRAKAWDGLDGADLARTVTCDAAYAWDEPSDTEWMPPSQVDAMETRLNVVVYDFGVKRNILRRLVSFGCAVQVVPAATPASEVLAMRPHGILLSNGPGDPAAVTYAVASARELIASRLPVLGICLGHQILAQALGARTYRLKFGHHGGNQPVKHLPSGRVEISAHNHNFAVDAATLPPSVEMTHRNLNDNCCEGFRHTVLPIIAIQYHPEAAPGPHDADPVFADFIRQMRKRSLSARGGSQMVGV